MQQNQFTLPRPRLNQFIDEYLKNDFNATQAALKVFRCNSRESAQALGAKYLKKAQPYVRAALDEKGVTLGVFLDIAIEKFETTNEVGWFDRLMILGGYETL